MLREAGVEVRLVEVEGLENSSSKAVA
jgi:hypothetical protein